MRILYVCKQDTCEQRRKGKHDRKAESVSESRSSARMQDKLECLEVGTLRNLYIQAAERIDIAFRSV